MSTDYPPGTSQAAEHGAGGPYLARAPEGSAARRLAMALARHLHLGGGLSEAAVSAVAAQAGVVLALAQTDALPSMSARPLAPTRCHRCGRALKKPVVYAGATYGTSCIRRVTTLRARTANTRHSGEHV